MNKLALAYIQQTTKPKFVRFVDDSAIQERVMRSNIEYKMLGCNDMMLRQVAIAQLSNEMHQAFEQAPPRLFKVVRENGVVQIQYA